MNLVFPAIRAAGFAVPLARAVLVLAASGLLLAAGNVSDTRPVGVASISDSVVAPISPATTAGDIVAETTVVAARPVSLAALVDSIDDAESAVAGDRDLNCLATAVYFESRGEPLEGQLAVAQAILNRVESGLYAETACRVIDQPGQFSFRRTRAPRAGEPWHTAKSIAVIAVRNLWTEIAPDAMSFHASYVAPGWGGKARTVRIGRHIFYH
jgi:spore germination cell wall hydrolase CwlJ-like protein